MKQYHDLSLEILSSKSSTYKPNRTGVDTISRFGTSMEFDLSEGFPVITTKRIHMRSVIHELLWFLQGDTNIKYLNDNDVTIWDEWADGNGNLGPVYGHQWRKWKSPDGRTIDQFSQALDTLKNSPDSRRIIVSAWNPADIDKMALPACHAFYQFNHRERDGKHYLDLIMYQRSADTFLGVPFNITSYALLNQMVAQEVGFEPGNFIHVLGDTHFYCGSGERGAWYGKNLDYLQERINAIKNGKEQFSTPKAQLEGYKELSDYLQNTLPGGADDRSDHIPLILKQLSREPKALPTMHINSGKSVLDLTYDDFELRNYEPHKGIIGKVAE